MGHDETDRLVAELTLLVSSPALSERDREAGQRLLRRLSAPVRIGVHGPDTALAEAVLSACRAGLRGGANATEVALASAFTEADIVLWSTQSFDPTERASWASAPDALKDHSFLVAIAPRPEHLAHLEDAAAEDFVGLHILSSPDAAAELGGLLRDLTQQITCGAQAIRDSVFVFLEKHRDKRPQADTALPTPEAKSPVAPMEVTPSGPSVLHTALSLLSEQGEALLCHQSAPPDDLCATIFEACSKTTEDLVELFSDDAALPATLLPLRDKVFEAADNVTLMSLENTLTSATDAVTVLLQVRKEISMGMAA